MRPTQEVIHQALDDIILRNQDKYIKSAVKDLEKVAKKTNKSIYEIMELIVNDMTDKGFYKF